MTEEHNDNSTADNASQNDSGDGPKKKRRRRRGGRGGDGGGGGDAQPQGEGNPERSSAESGSDAAPKKKRRRRGGGGGEAAQRASEQQGGGGGGGGSDPKRRRRPGADAENWEEIFNEQTFAELGLNEDVVSGCTAAGFKYPTKIQADLIPAFLEGGDILGQSRTGSGKTAAFGLPLLHMCEEGVAFQTLILAPTRELAIQIAAEIEDLGRATPLRVTAVYGGARIQTQADSLAKGPEIIVATPGRLMDMLGRGYLHFNNVRFAVLDEVDRMLDIGFRDDIKKILSSMHGDQQTVFVSATISDEIEKLSHQFMTNPKKLVASGGSLTVSLVDQYYVSVEPWDKKKMLYFILKHEDPELTLIFCRMKRTVDTITEQLCNKGIDAHAIHGDMYQGKRDSVMKRLRAGTLGVLVASDLAARGLDVDGITHVINYDLPEDPEVYVHRIGRTARGGNRGIAWSFVTPEQGPLLTEIEKLTNVHIPAQEYDRFEPGPLPRGVREERDRDTQMVEAKRGQSRYTPKEPVVAPDTKVDESRFPGGVVPTKLPPKLMRGKVKTTRSMRGQAKVDPPPAADDKPKD
jgi:ATP-dependent RNA helicase DeaD